MAGCNLDDISQYVGSSMANDLPLLATTDVGEVSARSESCLLDLRSNAKVLRVANYPSHLERYLHIYITVDFMQCIFI